MAAGEGQVQIAAVGIDAGIHNIGQIGGAGVGDRYGLGGGRLPVTLIDKFQALLVHAMSFP